MTKHKFTPAEKYALWKFHGAKCHLCDEPLRLGDATADHVIPEHLAAKPDELKAVLDAFGLPANFKLNDFGNWVPAHIKCNQKKSGTVFRTTPIIQMLIDRLQRDAAEVRRIEQRVTSNTIKDDLIGKVMVGLATDTITQSDLEALFPVYETVADEDTIALYDEVTLHVDPRRWKVSSRLSNETVTVTDGHLGGITPRVANPHASWICPSCGLAGPWNGVRCMTCGQMSDPND